MNPNNVQPDQKQREAALNQQHSYIVQAPAGSGKTSLLIQRFLILLSCAKNPEEILAITFTKKAAAEMRNRIIRALQEAEDNPEPCEPYLKKTWELAKAALKQDKNLSWHLLENPNKLHISTIDSLCATLTKHIPIISRFGSLPNVCENNFAFDLYEQAVENMLSQIDSQTPWNESLKQILIHLDNKTETVKRLFVNMLAKREQWLPYIVGIHSEKEPRDILERGLLNITKDCLETLTLTAPKELLSELIELLIFSESNLSTNVSSAVPEEVYTLLLTKNSVDSIDEQKELWLTLAKMLLTKENKWRKTVTKNNGFPSSSAAAKNSTEKALYTEMKNKMKLMLEQLTKQVGFKQALTELTYAPPLQYNNQQWHILKALLALLPVAAAQLLLVFREKQQVDYCEITQAALIALGSAETPTDLALYLDYKIQHILIDEFQDTSTIQLHLLEKLTAEWMPDDGRSIFLVGDPMQSVYSFRNAEVGLFLRARCEGIGQIELIPLTLSVNFRSEKNLVDWFNQTFIKVFPQAEDISKGAVIYVPTESSEEESKEKSVYIHSLINSDNKTEAKQISELLKQIKKTSPKKTVAVLVRSRTHLTEILPELRKNKLRYQAIEIEPLARRQVVQDLLALTKALSHLGDRTSWLAILRAPWCGLTLADLHTIASAAPTLTIWQNINKAQTFKALSKEGQLRLYNLKNIIDHSLKMRRRKKLRPWIEETWIALDGPGCVQTETDLEDATAYLQMLEQFDKERPAQDINSFAEQTNSLFSATDHLADDKLQVMTVHKAKGLEFDIVILPSLERTSLTEKKQLLLWAERTRTHKESDLILAPIEDNVQRDDAVYNYLSRYHKLKISFEEARLLYVATTRAKKQLHLFANIYSKEDKIQPPQTSSLLNLLWPALQNDFINYAVKPKKHEDDNPNTKVKSKFLNKISLAKFKTLQAPYYYDSYNETLIKPTELLQQDNTQRLIGILVHAILQQISLEQLEVWPTSRLEQMKPFWRAFLIRLGMSPTAANIDSALQQVYSAVHNALTDNRGRWILKNHKDAHSEFSLTYINENNTPQTLIIDRTFIDEKNRRWLIDYKTATTHTEQDPKKLEAFLQTEKQNHLLQLEHYAEKLYLLYNEEINFGLYFPSVPAWIEWK